MDGFAALSADLRDASEDSPICLHVVGDIAAGVVPNFQIHSGQCARIMTGAMLPAGADCVVPIELTDRAVLFPGEEPLDSVWIKSNVNEGDFIRTIGQDIIQGQEIFTQGKMLWPQDIGLLAMLGIKGIKVYRKPRIALISSGDELLQPGEDPVPGKIFDSNTYTLAGLIDDANCELAYRCLARDDISDIRSHLEAAIENQADILISSAGVSVGAYDYMREVVQETGELNFWRVNMRPGKPVAFGSYKNVPFIGLPGNPVSAYVGFEVFVRPALMKLAGNFTWQRKVQTVYLGEAISSDGRESYLRVIVKDVEGKQVAFLTGHQGSGNLLSLVQANAFIIVPSEVKSLPIGSQVKAWILK